MRESKNICSAGTVRAPPLAGQSIYYLFFCLWTGVFHSVLFCFGVTPGFGKFGPIFRFGPRLLQVAPPDADGRCPPSAAGSRTRSARLGDACRTTFGRDTPIRRLYCIFVHSICQTSSTFWGKLTRSVLQPRPPDVTVPM